MRGFVFILSLLLGLFSRAQFLDRFDDQDFTQNPAWHGDTAQFTVIEGKLRNNGPEESGAQYLSTPSIAIEDATWTFLIELDFAPSSSNKVQVYLVSNQENLMGELDGYFIEIGQSGSDQIKLYRKDGGSQTLLFVGTSAFTGDIRVRVRITRSTEGLWEVFADPSGADLFVSEGSAFQEDTHTSSSFFGVVCTHTSTRNDLFFFDDFEVTGTRVSDRTPPSIESVAAISANEVEVVFSEAVDQASAEDARNYAISPDINVLSAVLSDSNRVHLTTSDLRNGADYLLDVESVQDESGNTMMESSSASFSYLFLSAPLFREVVINEIFTNQGDANPITNDYIELLNATDEKFFDLSDWTLEDNNKNPDPMERFVLRPGAFLIVSSDTSEFESSVDKMEVSIDNFNNNEDHAVLRSATGMLIDSLGYERTEDGVSIEQINPSVPFFLSSNYDNSISALGGTPGIVNSIFNDTPDDTPPTIDTFSVTSDTTIYILFSEMLEPTTAEDKSNYLLADGEVVGTKLDESGSSVEVSIADIPANRSNQLRVSGIEDLFGNAMLPVTLEFTYFQTEPAAPEDVVINEFLSNPVDRQDDFVELYNNSEKFISMEGWRLLDESSTSAPFHNFVLKPHSYVIIFDSDAATDYSTYGDVIPIPSLTLNNEDDVIELVDDTNETIAYLEYGTTEKALSMELVNPEDPCISFSSYEVSSDPAGFTAGRRNSQFDETPDTTAPFIISYGYDRSLSIQFSEEMDPLQLSVVENYQVDGLTIDTVIVPEAFPTEVDLQFAEDITKGESYELLVSTVSDCAGNEIMPSSLPFAVGRQPTFNELIITEILSDEDPAVGLPEREYLEIFNASDDVISTSGLQLTDATKTVDFPISNLSPGTYYVVTSVAGALEFGSAAIGLRSFPSLNNSGELLVLSLADNLIHSVEFNSAWHDDQKAGGGYSLEMVDVNNPCYEGKANWRSSQHPSGGTPGEPNSVIEHVPDRRGPLVTSIVAISPDTIRIDFDESIDPTSVGTVQTTFAPTLNVREARMKLMESKSLYLILGEMMEGNRLYSLNISGIFDCLNNEGVSLERSFARPIQAEPDQIKLSEVLFNPRSNGVDFVEIFNDSENYISLNNWRLANLSDDEASDLQLISASELVINPKEYLVFTEDANLLLSNYPKGRSDQFIEISSLPTYPNEEGNVLLLSHELAVVEQFHYDQAYHYDLLEDVDGVSLERISFSEEVANASNWRSASGQDGYATPGYVNSQAVEIPDVTAVVEISPRVFVPGNSGSGRDFTTITYQFGSAGKFANVSIFDRQGRLVKKLVQGELLSTSGFLRWDGVTDRGAMAKLGYYVVLFEFYDASGNVEAIKKTVAVGRDF